MQQHYDAAFRFQNAGNLSQANSEYTLFLATALHRMANGQANLGDYASAVPLYDEALRLASDDRSLRMDYASAALDASDWKNAKSLAASVLDGLKNNALPPDPHAVSVLAQSLLELGEHEEALEQFQIAAKLRPGFDSSSRLATAYLVFGDKSNAAKVVAEIQKTSGDTATVHMKLGILYGKVKFFDEAIEEFRIAIAKDDRLKGAHYSLGASYMMQSGGIGSEKAEAEFRKEIALDPDNSLVYAPLGRIAMSRHKYEEAEADLKHAVALNPQSAGTYLILGQLFRDIGKNPEAIAAFRKAIALTLDPSKNNYEVEQAHFWLGRLMIQSGSTAEGHHEMDISQNLLYQKEQLLESRQSGSAIPPAPLDKTHEADPGDLAAQKAFEKQTGPLIASSYDNLGVNAANAGEFANAAGYFAKAAQWNPGLGDIDKNWGRAAFAAREYAQAVGPLSRTLALHPDNADVRSMTGLSLYMIHDYTQTLRVLEPMEANLGANPLLTIAYAGSMAIAGDYSQGLARLNALEEAHPDAAILHCLLGEAYANQKLYDQSANELQIALKLDPSSAESKNALALTDVALGRKTEALQLLSELAEAGSTDGEVYYRLGRLQSELGSAKAAVGNLETAIRLDPMNAAYHQELADAYRRNAQPDDADREARQSATLQAQNEFNHPSGNSHSGSGSHSGDPLKVQKN
jgi:tetratricopeptide (TPR) repeat protein